VIREASGLLVTELKLSTVKAERIRHLPLGVFCHRANPLMS
ncbi:hypothetical protein NPIL_306691, partial [Nephila pilipes]